MHFINTFIQQGCITLIGSDSKDIYHVTKDFYFRKMLFFPQKSLFPQKYEAAVSNIDKKCILSSRSAY